jgi:hypothetical protein
VTSVSRWPSISRNVSESGSTWGKSAPGSQRARHWSAAANEFDVGVPAQLAAQLDADETVRQAWRDDQRAVVARKDSQPIDGRAVGDERTQFPCEQADEVGWIDTSQKSFDVVVFSAQSSR